MRRGANHNGQAEEKETAEARKGKQVYENLREMWQRELFVPEGLPVQVLQQVEWNKKGR